jgi:glycosidase
MNIFTLPVRLLVAVVLLSAGTAMATEPHSLETCLKRSSLANDVGCNKLLSLQVASPEWQDQIIYFVLVDRFFDGDTSNNDQGTGEYAPKVDGHFSGGDIKGVIQKLDYIQALGATALWTTPIVANLWWDPRVNYGGYHGYWARDFKRVDEHFGELADYRLLSHQLHNRGMYLIQDVVVNHVGNFFSYMGEYDPKDPTHNFSLNTQATPSTAPTQYPFNLNDVNIPEHRAAAIYHWTPEISDFSNRTQETTFQSGMLNDLNTENPMVRDALKDSYAYWIKEVGVDAVRIDTVKYVEAEFYQDFLHGRNSLTAVASDLGKKNFFSFGEIYTTSSPYGFEGERKIAEYLHQENSPRIDGPVGFPLYKDINRVFAGSAPTAYVAHRLKAQMESYVNPYLAVNFIDNHDVERFLSGGSIDGFKQAYTLMFTVPGLPTIYQGDEQGFSDARRALFAGGYKNETDQFNAQSDLYLFIQSLAALRKSHPVFSRGDLTILEANENGPGILAYTRQYKDKKVFVVFNSSDNATLLNRMATGFNANQKIKPLFSHNINGDFDTAVDGSLTKLMPPRSILIFEAESLPEGKHVATRQDSLTIGPAEVTYVNQSRAHFSGQVSAPAAHLSAIVDGQVKSATEIVADANGGWQVEVPVDKYGEHTHTLEIYWPEKNIATERFIFNASYNLIELSSRVKDKRGDDRGLSGKYRLPLHPTIGCQMDITQASAIVSGRFMELTLEMCEVSALWDPPNHFDHVAFSIYFAPPKTKGALALPLLRANFPDKSGWSFAHIAYGWGNYIYSNKGSSTSAEGTKISVAPKILVDRSNKTIRFQYDADLIGLQDWTDVKVYVTTWDKGGEGAYRGLTKEPSMWTFAAPDIKAPLILDAAILKL